jgi:hypothetical protein
VTKSSIIVASVNGDIADDFAGAVDNAARKLRLAAEFVEKDYWVT